MPDPIGYPGDLVWHRMRPCDGEPYLRAEERDFLRGFLAGLAPSGELPLVRFHPAAEALFYAELEGVEFRAAEPVFRPQRPDWYLLRRSRWRGAGSLERALFAHARIDPGDRAHRILERGETEHWFAVRP